MYLSKRGIIQIIESYNRDTAKRRYSESTIIVSIKDHFHSPII